MDADFNSSVAAVASLTRCGALTSTMLTFGEFHANLGQVCGLHLEGYGLGFGSQVPVNIT